MVKFIYSESVQAVIGLLFASVAGILALLQLTRIPMVGQSLSLTYISLLIIPIGFALLLMGTYPKRLLSRRQVDKEEIQSLLSEAKSRGLAPDRLNEHEAMLRGDSGELAATELDVLSLRRELVDCYQIEDLVAKLKYELQLFKEYAEEDDPTALDNWANLITKLIEDLERSGKTDDECQDIEKKMRANLKTLLETVAYYDRAWAEGEVIFRRVLYWASITAFVMITLGSLPLVHSLGGGNLSYFHWSAFGIAGSLLATLVGVHDPSIPELGETKGRYLLQKVLLGFVMGGMSAILLYASLSGGILAGKLFPSIPYPQDNIYWVNTGMSIFWAIMAGAISSRILTAFMGIAEGGIGRGAEE
ncbi:MAG: hypothetical protein IIA59_06195 [Candidatus Marinimicrobia bacterium]|nr:hypothetical protein [Candidatus Neomarinimicrobiota bacterium]